MTSKKAVARLPWLVLVLLLCVYLNSNVWAQDDGETGTLHRTIVVHPMSTGPKDSGTELLEAMASITEAAPGIGDTGPGIMTASATNPWLIKLDAGVYDLGTASLVMKPYVDIEGSGEDVTTITGAGSPNSASGTVIGASNAELRFLTVKNTGGNVWAIAVLAAGNSPLVVGPSPNLTHVTLTSSGASLFSVGMMSFFSTAVLTNVTVEMPAGGRGLVIGDGVTLRNVVVTVSTGPAASNTGIILSTSDAGGPSITLDNVTVVSSGVALDVEEFTSATVDRSTLQGGIQSIFSTGASSLAIGASQLSGPVAASGRLTCVSVYNSLYTPLNSSCQNPPSLTSITPNTGVQGTSVNVTLTGTGLTGVTSISVSGTGVTASGLTVLNSTTVTATFTIAPTASLGARNVILTTPGVAINPVVTFTVN
jgi:hypothetical protein